MSNMGVARGFFGGGFASGSRRLSNSLVSLSASRTILAQSGMSTLANSVISSWGPLVDTRMWQGTSKGACTKDLDRLAHKGQLGEGIQCGTVITSSKAHKTLLISQICKLGLQGVKQPDPIDDGLVKENKASMATNQVGSISTVDLQASPPIINEEGMLKLKIGGADLCDLESHLKKHREFPASLKLLVGLLFA